MTEKDIAAVRISSGVPRGSGPDDVLIQRAIDGFVRQFEFWYVRVIQEAVPKYRHLIIERINPFVRRMECEGLGARAVAERIVRDYDARNFVTAGGWALEEMALLICSECQKSTATGIDIQRLDRETGDHHLYVVKSGLVTRNSDIVAALKRNAREAEKRLRQSRSTAKVVANYAICAGKTSSTFEDGIRRPSSAEFWSEMTGLPDEESTRLVLAVASQAANIVKRDASSHTAALICLVEDYIRRRDDPEKVDWEFLAQRTLGSKDTWSAEDAGRHLLALAALRASGYTQAAPRIAGHTASHRGARG
jgi:hypothetical protein